MRSLSFVAVAFFAAAMVVSSGCGEATKPAPAPSPETPAASAETSSTTPAATTEGELTKVSLNVTGMSWPSGWGSKIKKAIDAVLPGAEVDVKSGSCTVAHADADADVVIKAIEGAGFGATVN